MPSNTALGLPIPLESDPFSDGALAMRNLAAALDVKRIRKAADQSVTNSAVLVNDTHFLFPVEAGKTYGFDLALFVASGTQLADLKLGFSFPAGTLSFGAHGLDPAGSTSPLGAAGMTAFPTAVSGVSAVALGAGGEGMVLVSGTFVCTAAGNVRLMWAQNTANATATTIRAGSKLRAEVIP